jgi:hypothetical protein
MSTSLAKVPQNEGQSCRPHANNSLICEIRYDFGKRRNMASLSPPVGSELLKLGFLFRLNPKLLDENIFFQRLQEPFVLTPRL